MFRILALTLASVGLMLAGSAGDNKPDFSGNWTLNLDQSKFGKGAKPMGMTLKVTRDGEVAHAVQTTNTAGGPTEFASDWIIDGKEHDTTGNPPGKLTTKWEGNTLYSERKANDGTFVQRIWLSLSSDGKTAKEKVWTKGAEGTNIANLVWERR